MDRKQAALDANRKMFNCAQSVFYAFAVDVGIDKETALKVSACFGGGMKCGEVCGAVTGSLMALGMKYGTFTENDIAGKQLSGKIAIEFMKKFKQRNPSILCRELTGLKPEEMREAAKKGLHPAIC